MWLFACFEGLVPRHDSGWFLLSLGGVAVVLWGFIRHRESGRALFVACAPREAWRSLSHPLGAKNLIVSPSGARLYRILLNITLWGRFYKALEINRTMLKNVK